MQVTGVTENRVFKMVVFKVTDRVAHFVVTTGEWLLPDGLVITDDPCAPVHGVGRLTDPNHRAKRAEAQFRVRQIEVIDSLHHMVGKLIS